MKKLITCALCILIITGIKSQDIVLHTLSSAGNYQEADGVQFGWNLGEACIHTWTNSGTILTEGFYQNFDFILSENTFYSPVKIMTYPNPTLSSFCIDRNTSGEILDRAILSMLGGETVLEKSISSYPAEINVSSLKPGIFILRLYDRKQALIAIHKIIKIEN